MGRTPHLGNHCSKGLGFFHALRVYLSCPSWLFAVLDVSYQKISKIAAAAMKKQLHDDSKDSSMECFENEDDDSDDDFLGSDDEEDNGLSDEGIYSFLLKF